MDRLRLEGSATDRLRLEGSTDLLVIEGTGSIPDPPAGPTYVFQYDASTLPPNTWSVTSGGTAGMTLDSVTSGLLRPPALKLEQPAGSACYGFHTFTPIAQTSAVMYFRTPSAWSASAAIILAGRPSASSSVHVFRVSMAGTGNPGQIRFIKSGAIQVASSANGLMSNSTLYRVEVNITHSAGTTATARCRLFLGDGTTAIWDSGSITGDFGADINRLDYGMITSFNPATPALWIDDVRLVADATYFHGPYVPGPYVPPAGPSVKVWDGTNLVAATYHVWDGTNLVAATPSTSI